MTFKSVSYHSALQALPNTNISPQTQPAGRDWHYQPSEGFCGGLRESCWVLVSPERELQSWEEEGNLNTAERRLNVLSVG